MHSHTQGLGSSGKVFSEDVGSGSTTQLDSTDRYVVDTADEREKQMYLQRYKGDEEADHQKHHPTSAFPSRLLLSITFFAIQLACGLINLYLLSSQSSVHYLHI
jgi:hypothetical protein